MKKILFISMSLLLTLGVTAQTEKGQMVVGANVGFSLTGGLIRTALNVSDSTIGSFETSVTPAIAVNFDYAVSDKFSIGVLYSFQSFSGSVTDYIWYDSINGVNNKESFDWSLIRNNISISWCYSYR